MADETEQVTSFEEFGLDDRITRAISKLNWSKPTPIQEKAITLGLEGKDILARAKTGSGKTAAYAIPLIQQILNEKQNNFESEVRALVLVPTKELAQQAYRNLQDLSCYCSRDVRVVDVAQGNLSNTKPLLLSLPDVVVATPSGLLGHIQSNNVNLKESLQILVIDEADLVFSYGYEDDLKLLLNHLPKIYQAFLMSATLTEDVKSLKKMVLHNPVTLKLNESQLPENDRLTQYMINLVQGKTLLFVNGIDRCYRLHIVDEFNRDIYDYIIASDETVFEKVGTLSSKSRKKNKKDKEYGVSRGIDFQGVENVINFDFPTDVESYIHRVGRTARGDSSGTALSFTTHNDNDILERARKQLTKEMGEKAELFKPYQFKMDEIEGFRYRAQDALRAVTKTAVKEARLKEIKREIINSEKLKAYFEDNPRDLQVLRHDKELHPARVQAHMKNVPDYLVPATLKQNMPTRKRKTHNFHHKSGFQSVNKKKKLDPLKTFKYSKEKPKHKGRRKTK